MKELSSESEAFNAILFTSSWKIGMALEGINSEGKLLDQGTREGFIREGTEKIRDTLLLAPSHKIQLNDHLVMLAKHKMNTVKVLISEENLVKIRASADYS
jgi:hypothetical protein